MLPVVVTVPGLPAVGVSVIAPPESACSALAEAPIVEKEIVPSVGPVISAFKPVAWPAI